jgi:hypothetical protein
VIEVVVDGRFDVYKLAMVMSLRQWRVVASAWR